jgi:23S rRNA (adenine1618-N6)-methyltransferase
VVLSFFEIMDKDLSQHPPYDKVDFKVLAGLDNDFKKIWQKSNGHLNFQDPETCTALTKATLKIDFGLKLDIPDDRLCPPVPNRWNYVAWIQNLLDSTDPSYSGNYDPERKAIGLDIGVGASAIYTLLALRSRPSWEMCVTDIDKKSFDSAARNLALNNLITRTKMLHTTADMSLIPLRYLGVDKLDFTICNPPFFNDEKEMEASLKGKGKNVKPSAICTGSENEMVCEGGDAGFVKRIVVESLELKDRVTWYTSMLGKLSSVTVIVKQLKLHGINNWAVGCLEPGSTTKRWIVAWSFGDLRPRNDIARAANVAHELLPFPTKYQIHIPESYNGRKPESVVHDKLSSLDLRCTWDLESYTGTGEAAQNVWNRHYRREKKRKQRAGEAVMQDTGENMEVALAFRINFANEEGEETILIDWLRGTDVQLWESFCGMVHSDFMKS